MNDNLGITLLKATRQDSDVCIVSNAGASFDADRDQRFLLRTSWITRVTDILIHRVAEADGAGFAHKPRRLLWDIRNVPSQQVSGFATDFATWLEKVRTDLDSFSKLEVRALVRHGYAVAHRKWSESFRTANTQGWDAAEPGTGGLLSQLETGLDSFAQIWLGDQLLSPKSPENTKAKLKRSGRRFRLDFSLLPYVPALALALSVLGVYFDQLYTQPNEARRAQAAQSFATDVVDAIWTALRQFGDTLADQPPEKALPHDVNEQGRIELWKEFRRKLTTASSDRSLYEQLSNLPKAFYDDLTQPTDGYFNYDEIARNMFDKALDELELNVDRSVANDPTATNVQDELTAAHSSARRHLADTIRCRLRAAAFRLAASRGELVPRRPVDAAVPKMAEFVAYRDERNEVLVGFEFKGGRLSNGQLCYELIHSANDRPDDVSYSPRRAAIVRQRDDNSVQLRIPGTRFDAHWYVRLVVEYPVDESKVGKAAHVALDK